MEEIKESERFKEKELVQITKKEVREIERWYLVICFLILNIACVFYAVLKIAELSTIWTIITCFIILLAVIVSWLCLYFVRGLNKNPIKYMNKWSRKKYEIID